MSQLSLWPGYAVPQRIIFHADFDGICSAALLCRFFDYEAELEPITYSIKNSWLRQHLENAAIVDFLYHPDAMWWFDHHVTSFINEELKSEYVPDLQHRWDITYKSCPSLILDVLAESTDIINVREQFKDWVQWSDIIDSAQYITPHQAVLGEEPCILINQALSQSPDSKLRIYLAKQIINDTNPKELAMDSYVSRFWGQFRKQQDLAIQEIGKRLRYIGSVGFCDLVNITVPFVRYGIYLIAPDISYSIIAYSSDRSKKKYYISLSHNPWHKNDSALENLGDLAKSYGGGGRETVASIPLSNAEECSKIAEQLAKRLAIKKQTAIEVEV